MDATPQPRRRNPVLTKARILSAANACFAETGYAGTGLRDIAARAGVASSLVVRYFGSKAALFEAALVDTIAAHSVFTLEKRGFGAAMARLMIEQTDISITAMLVPALADPRSKAVAARVARRDMIEPLAAWLGPPEAMARASDLFALLTGFTIRVEAMTGEAVAPTSLDWLARTLQAIVDDHG